ncbi:6-phosphogluconolactonase [[Leptolyngbya] sp. PCC 7376]|uniref:6-phosphogluconolactonase n=1 Tax=[Leptolyngbya] sp. PCC 7376 TaxID=111781 RepID=UPI00029F2B1F|nr:6-phosphogluconolactonase [[Leptolyngbya] sp. PCC 7376]AFY37367.1 6-phosphogluconolactonase [[Leptolyngbya] sp. PCC 7376]
MTKFLEILDDKSELVKRALKISVNCIQEAIAKRGKCSIALAGGSTPKPLYEKLAAQNLDWNNIYIFWGDERYVPADHPDSNEKMAREAWLNQCPIPAQNIFPMPTGADPATDAATYEQTLQDFFGSQDNVGFDLMFLGMGDDGHTASLFPQTAALDVGDRLVAVGQKQEDSRITLTLPTINASHNIIFLVAGANKQDALQQVFHEDCDPKDYPSKFIQPKEGRLWWLLDAAAGEKLSPDGAIYAMKSR